MYEVLFVIRFRNNFRNQIATFIKIDYPVHTKKVYFKRQVRSSKVDKYYIPSLEIQKCIVMKFTTAIFFAQEEINEFFFLSSKFHDKV